MHVIDRGGVNLVRVDLGLFHHPLGRGFDFIGGLRQRHAHEVEGSVTGQRGVEGADFGQIGRHEDAVGDRVIELSVVLLGIYWYYI